MFLLNKWELRALHFVLNLVCIICKLTFALVLQTNRRILHMQCLLPVYNSVAMYAKMESSIQHRSILLQYSLAIIYLLITIQGKFLPVYSTLLSGKLFRLKCSYNIHQYFLHIHLLSLIYEYIASVLYLFVSSLSCIYYIVKQTGSDVNILNSHGADL